MMNAKIMLEAQQKREDGLREGYEERRREDARRARAQFLWGRIVVPIGCAILAAAVAFLVAWWKSG